MKKQNTSQLKFSAYVAVILISAMGCLFIVGNQSNAEEKTARYELSSSSSKPDSLKRVQENESMDIFVKAANTFFVLDLQLGSEEKVSGTVFIQDFQNSVFSTYVPFSFFYSPQMHWSKVRGPRIGVNFQEEFPWIYPYFFLGDQKPPAFSVLNRWKKDIIVSTGLPNNFKPVNQEFENETFKTTFIDHFTSYYFPPYNAREPELERSIENEAQKIIPLLSELTGKSITFLPYTSESQKEYGNIRIIYTDKIFDPEKSVYKNTSNPPYSTSSKPTYAYYELERQLFYGVRFSPKDEQGVEGYFLTNGDNEIELAVCYIWNQHPPSIIKRLVHECLVKSLGLPEVENLSQHQADSGQMLSSRVKLLLKTLYHQDLDAGLTYAQTLPLLSNIFLSESVMKNVED